MRTFEQGRYKSEKAALDNARCYLDTGDKIYLCRDRRGHFWAAPIDTWLHKSCRIKKLIKIPKAKHAPPRREPYVLQGYSV